MFVCLEADVPGEFRASVALRDRRPTQVVPKRFVTQSPNKPQLAVKWGFRPQSRFCATLKLPNTVVNNSSESKSDGYHCYAKTEEGSQNKRKSLGSGFVPCVGWPVLLGTGTGRQLLWLPPCGVREEEAWSKRPAGIPRFAGRNGRHCRVSKTGVLAWNRHIVRSASSAGRGRRG